MKATESQKKIVSAIANDCLFVRLRLINRVVGKIYETALKPHEIKATQFTVLVAVSASEPTTSKGLSELLHMDPSTFSRALGILKKKGHLETEPSGDGKILNIKITQKGLKKIESAYPDWLNAQKLANDVLGNSAAQKIISTGTQYLNLN